MATHGMHVHWSMTINNYDANEVALIQQGYPEYIRQLVYTFEEGKEEGTPHIQAYIKMKASARLAAMRKLFPRGRFRFIDNDEYKLNAQRYAQKLDVTARSPATITNFEPLHTIEGVVKKVMRRVETEMAYIEYSRQHLTAFRIHFEKVMVQEDYTLAKVFISATYKQMWKEFGEAMYSCLAPQFALERKVEAATVEEPHTHAHTHMEKIISREGGITTDASQVDTSQDEPEASGSEEGEDYEGDLYSEGTESCTEDESDNSGCSQSDAESEDGD